jgi:predicted acylesterase/phospholipase RssA
MVNMKNNNKMKIGYALGGGAALGLSHIGVLKVLEEYGIFPDIITGTSMGAIIGALYAGGHTAREIERLVLGLNWKKLMSLADITFLSGGFIRGNRVVILLQSIMGDLTFSQLKYSYACAATDVFKGEEVILRDGSLVDAIHASIALPGIFKPVLVKGRYLVDGGLLNEVPVNVCRQMGAEYVIGVNVIPDPGKVMCVSHNIDSESCYQLGLSGESPEHSLIQHLPLTSRLSAIENAVKSFIQSHQSSVPNDKLGLQDSGRKNKSRITRPPTLWDVLRQSLAITQYHVAMENIKLADLAISPDVGEIGFWQFNKAPEAIKAGEKAARIALQQSNLINSLSKVTM